VDVLEDVVLVALAVLVLVPKLVQAQMLMLKVAEVTGVTDQE